MLNSLLPYLKSRTVWGGVLMFVANILKVTGHPILDDALIQQILDAAANLVGIILVIVGRAQAAGPLASPESKDKE